MKNLKSSIILFFLFVISCSENRYTLSFDIMSQEIVECEGKPLNNLLIENDSIIPNGNSIGDDIQIEWSPKNNAPSKINIQRIPREYKILFENSKVFRPMKNTSYTLSTHYYGKERVKIKIWTDRNGRVYKASNMDCDSALSDK